MNPEPSTSQNQQKGERKNNGDNIRPDIHHLSRCASDVLHGNCPLDHYARRRRRSSSAGIGSKRQFVRLGIRLAHRREVPFLNSELDADHPEWIHQANDDQRPYHLSISKTDIHITDIIPLGGERQTKNSHLGVFHLVRRLGIEPRTLGLRGPCSTS
jgi:hypothetical protein